MLTASSAARSQTGIAVLGAVLLLGLALGGCSSSPSSDADTTDPCLSAAQRTNGACTATAQRPPLQIQALPIDDEALYSRLKEIKIWLADEKARLRGEPLPSAQAANDELIPAAPAGPKPASSPDETLAAAIALADRGQNQAALLLIRDYRTLREEDLSAALIESRLLFQSGDVTQAEALLRHLLMRHPSSAELYNNLAVLQAARGDLGGAIDTLQQAFATDPSFARIQRNLKALYSASASQALLQERQPARPRLEMIDLVSGL